MSPTGCKGTVEIDFQFARYKFTFVHSKVSQQLAKG